MAYHNEATIKMSIICVINQLAEKLGVRYSFDSLDSMRYTDLELTRDELLTEYNEYMAMKPKNKRK